MEIIFLRNMVSQLRNNDICQTVTRCVCILRMHTGVIRPRGVNVDNRRLIEAKIKGCQVRHWTVGARDMSCSCLLCMTCVNGSKLMSKIVNTMD